MYGENKEEKPGWGNVSINGMCLHKIMFSKDQIIQSHDIIPNACMSLPSLNKLLLTISNDVMFTNDQTSQNVLKK